MITPKVDTPIVFMTSDKKIHNGEYRVAPLADDCFYYEDTDTGLGYNNIIAWKNKDSDYTISENNDIML